MKNAVVDYIADKQGIKNKALIEKDIYLHRLLLFLSSQNLFSGNYAFKGGTCLTKCYYGYYRFSEDLDFSYVNQDEFKQKSQKEIRRIVNKKIDSLILLLEKHAKESNMDFKPGKSDTHYIELGGSSKFTTFKLWYNSGVIGVPRFIKIQINFFEQFAYPFNNRKANSLTEGINKDEFAFLFPEDSNLLVMPHIKCYSHDEILIEKVRAILTRKSVKARDFIDVFMLTGGNMRKIKSIEKEIIAKIRFMLRYEKYIQNLRDFKLEEFVLGDEANLLLIPMAKGFHEFLPAFHIFLNELADKIRQI